MTLLSCHGKHQTHQTYPGGVELPRLRRPMYSNRLLAMRHVAITLPHNGYRSLHMYGNTRISRCTSCLVMPASSTCVERKCMACHCGRQREMKSVSGQTPSVYRDRAQA